MEVRRPRDDGAVALRARAAVGRWRVYPLPGSARQGSVPDPGEDSCLGRAGAREPPAPRAYLWAAGGAGSRLGGAALGAGARPRAVDALTPGSRRRTPGAAAGTPLGRDPVSARRPRLGGCARSASRAGPDPQRYQTW